MLPLAEQSIEIREHSDRNKEKSTEPSGNISNTLWQWMRNNFPTNE